MSAHATGVSEARDTISRSVGIAILVGLVLGLITGWIVAQTRPDIYITSSTFALVPKASPVQEGSSDVAEPGQLALLTPVVSSMSTDPATIDAIKGLLGRDPGVIFAPSLVANSPLLFDVQVEGDTPERTTEAARAMEEVLTTADEPERVLSDYGADLIVTSSAQVPESDHMIPNAVIALGSGLAGALIGAGASVGYGRYARKTGTVRGAAGPLGW